MPNSILNQADGQMGSPGSEVQEIIDKFIANGLRIVHDEKVSEGFAKRIKNAGNPVTAIAETTLSVVDRLENEASQKGINIPKDALAGVANILMGEIIKVSEIAGLEPLTDEQKYQAFSLAISKYLDSSLKSGRMTKDQLVQLSEQAKQTPEGQKIMQDFSQGGRT